MGKKSGPPAPPPPPDYTKQRQNQVRSENYRRGNIAKAYNSRVDDFNTQLSGFGSTLDNYTDTVSGLKLGDDLSGLGDIQKDLKALDRNFAGVSQGDVGFLESNEERVADNKRRFNTDKAAYESLYADEIGAQRSKRDQDRFNERENLQQRMLADGVDLASPGAVFSWKKQNNVPLIDISGLSSSISNTLYGDLGEGIEDFTYDPYGGRNFGDTGTYYDKQLDYDAFGMPVDPGFQAAGTSYGGAVAYDMPTLNKLNVGMTDRYQTQIDDIEALISGLRSEETAEKGRIEDFFSDYVNQANAADIDVEFADINDDFGKYARELAVARNDINAFDSVLGFNDNRTAALNELTELENIIAGRTSAKELEQGRVDTASGAARTEIDDLIASLDRMGIADADAETIEALTGRLDTQRGALRDFESDLDFNFSNELADLYDLDEDIYSLGQQRAAEQSRLSGLGRNFQNRADSLGRISDRQDMYNLSEIEDLQDALSALEADIGGVTSDLSTDFSGASAGLSGARASLDELLGGRNQALEAQRNVVAELLSGRVDDPTTDIDESLAGLQDIALSDESGLMSRRSDFERELADLGRFQGGTTANVNAIEDAIGQVDARLRELGGERGGIESDALASLQDIRNREFFNPSDVDTARQEVEQIRQRAETFGAQQAADELAALEQVLAKESNRLAGDADEVAFREGQGAAEIEALLDQFGNLQFPSVGDANDVMTEEQLNAFLANQSEEDELLNMLNQSSFAQNIALGRN